MDPGKKLISKTESDSDCVSPYKELVGSLIYISTCTRPDISFSVNKHAQHFSAPTEEHFQSAIKILGYLCSTKELGLSLGGRCSPEIILYADADFAGDEQSRFSVTGNLIYVGNSLVSWTSKKQKLIATSSTEAEYLAVFYSLRDVQYINQFLDSIYTEIKFSITFFQDNLSTMALIQNESSKGRSKHFDVKLKSVAAAWRAGYFQMQHVQSAEMLADIMTKPLNRNLHQRLRLKIMST